VGGETEVKDDDVASARVFDENLAIFFKLLVTEE